jgi:hypothetical protein
MGRSVVVISFISALLLASPAAAAAEPAASAVAEPAAGDVAAVATAAADRVLSGEFPFGMALALDAGGHRHVVASDKQGDLWYASDRGGAWEAQEILPAPWDTDAGWPLWAWTSPTIAIDTDGSVHVAVVRSSVGDTPGTTYGIYYTTDKGRAGGDFGPRTKITADGMSDPSLRVVDGVRYLAYSRYQSFPGQKVAPLFFKTDRGGAWQTERIDDWASAPSLRVASNGRAHIAYEDENGLRYTRARSRVGDFTIPARIPGSKGSAGEPSLALDSADRAHVAWAAWRESQQVLYAKRTAAGWVAPRQVGTGWTAELSLDSGGRPHVVFARGFGKGKVVHRWLAGGDWRMRTMVSGANIDSVDMRAFGKGASIAWAQSTTPRGVWIVRD